LSIWTHVVGIIRFDAIPIPGCFPSIKEVGQYFNEGVPEGSEGPLQFKVIKYPPSEYGSVLYCKVIIWGDLRDFGLTDVPKIIGWIERSCKKCTDNYLIIRQGVIQIQVEYGPVIIMHTTGNSWKNQ